MEALLKKLNFKENAEVLIHNLPNELSAILEDFSPETRVIQKSEETLQIEFALIFVLEKRDLEDILPKIDKKCLGDCILWFCYPKKSSKKYKTSMDRDHGWEALGRLGFEPVRQVSIDENFSALRFRKLEYIKKLTRTKGTTLSERAKKMDEQ